MNTSNDNLLDRARELSEEFVSHPAGLDTQLINAAESGDMEEVARLVSICEGYLAQEHFHNYDLIGDRDVY